jgi:hypothetical protein
MGLNLTSRPRQFLSSKLNSTLWNNETGTNLFQHEFTSKGIRLFSRIMG